MPTLFTKTNREPSDKGIFAQNGNFREKKNLKLFEKLNGCTEFLKHFQKTFQIFTYLNNLKRQNILRETYQLQKKKLTNSNEYSLEWQGKQGSSSYKTNVT